MTKGTKYLVLLLGMMLLFFGGICLLWLSGNRDTYFSTMHFMGVYAWTRPFLDMTGVLSMSECHRFGIDVTKNNPCDPLHRLLDYGPPVLHSPFSTADTDMLGIIQGMMLLVALACVLRPRKWHELAVDSAAGLSCSVLYALERGNLDVLEFMIVALGGGLSMQGRGGRVVSYVLYYTGGTLKFYPFALLLTILRERLSVAVGLGVVGAAAIGMYGFLYHDALTAVGSAMPPFEYNTDVFGASCLPFGLADWLGLPMFVGAALMAILVVSFGVTAWRVASRVRGELEPAAFERLNFRYLLVGAVVMVGCFVSHSSISYRAIFLLFLLPGFFDLYRVASLRRLFAAAIAAAIFCLWSEFFRQWGEAFIDAIEDLLAPERPDSLAWEIPSFVFFVFRELLWWWLIAVMSAIIGLFALDSPAAQGLRRLITPAGRPPTPHAGTS